MTDFKEEESLIIEPKKSFWITLFGWFNNLITSDKPIGELNGKWASALKLLIILFFMCVPTFFAWASWVTTNTWDNTNTINYLIKYTESLPPEQGCSPNAEWRRRIELIENVSTKFAVDMLSLDKSNSLEHSQILILLEGIKTKLELISDKQYE